MVWVAFYRDDTQWPLVIMRRDPKAKRNGYTIGFLHETLDQGPIPIYEPGYIFMQDNASVHMRVSRKAAIAPAETAFLKTPPSVIAMMSRKGGIYTALRVREWLMAHGVWTMT